MSRLRPWFLLTAVWFFAANSVFASDYAVGTCRPGLKSFSTISAAVATVPAGSTVHVCPGTYAEQVVISQPLTLEGLSDGTSDQVIVAASAGVAANATTADGRSLAAQIWVTTGPVNIRKITVDGTGNGLNGSVLMAGIYYGSGASGVIGGVTARNQMNAANGVGIYVENGNSASETVTIENCSVHDFDFIGIWLNANVNATVVRTYINDADQGDFTYAVLVAYPDNRTVAKIADNVVVGPGSNVDAQGITNNTSSATIKANTLAGWYFAAADFGPTSYLYNSASDNKIGFYLGVPGGGVQNNSILESYAAIDFNCNAGTATGNVINDANFAMYLAMPGPDPSNDLFNVATIQNGGCGPATRAAAVSTSSATATDEPLKHARRGGKP